MGAETKQPANGKMGNSTEQNNGGANSAVIGQDDAIAQGLWLHRYGDEYRARLLQNIKTRLPQLEKLLADLEDEQAAEDGVYRFYHGSYKVYGVQHATTLIVDALKELLPDRPLNAWFGQIVALGTGHKFEDENNDNWFTTTRAIIEAFYHAHYFLEMAVKYGREFDEPPNCMPSGWAAVLYLFNLR